MQETVWLRDERGRQLIQRTWRNTDGELHRTTGPAAENWTALPGGAPVLSFQGWYVNGRQHRKGRPAGRLWHVAADGTRVLLREEWVRHGRRHRVGGPSWRRWTKEPDGTRRLEWEEWAVNGKLHRVDGPALDGRSFDWHDVEVTREDLPWLRRGRDLLVPLAAFTAATPMQRSDGGGSGGSRAWNRDARVAITGADSVLAPTLTTYRSAVGGSVLLCV